MAHRPLLAIVDDDEALLLSLANLVRSLGFRVERFPSPEAFLSSPERHRTACLIVDVRMPGMDGPGLVRELAGRHRRVPFIFMSAYTDAATLADVSQLGAAGFLQKPCQEADLVAAINTALAATGLLSGTAEPESGDSHMSTITTMDGTTIFFKDWGPKDAQPIVFHHGWPLSADDWDAQMLYFLEKGYRVIAHDRRGHGRSSQVSDGHDMDHYAADIAAVVTHLALRNAIHVGHSTGGGEAAHYVARHGEGRVDKLVIIAAVPPIMLKTPANPGGLPIEVFDGFRQQLAANRAQFYREVASGPFYGYNRPGAEVSDAVVENWWRQGMMGGAKAHYDGIKAFSETDFTEDLKIIDVPTLVMHGDDDQIVPIADSAPLSAKLLKKGTLKIYEKLPHGICTTHADVINPDLLAFIQS